MNWNRSIFKWIVLCLVLSLSGCSSYHPAYSNYPLQNLRYEYHRDAPVRNGNIEYYRFGTGSPIVLIPGYLTDVSSWDRNFLVALAQHHDVIVINNRNVGRSVISSSHCDSKDLAEDTSQLIQVLELKKPAVLGISMGGMIAQQLAVLHPKEVGSLILINTFIAGSKAIRPSSQVQQKMSELPSNVVGRYIFAMNLFFPSSSRMQMSYELIANRFLPPDYKPLEAQAVITQQQSLVKNWLEDNVTSAKLSHTNLPVLILNGESDAIIPPVNSTVLANTYNHSQLVRWKEGGHAMIYQFPEQLADTINQFLNSSE
jgi:pimeloyl-ACP methyl ester carboxylesterase